MTRVSGIVNSPPAPRTKDQCCLRRVPEVLPHQGVPALSCIENAGSLVLRRSCCASWLFHWPCQVLRRVRVSQSLFVLIKSDKI